MLIFLLLWIYYQVVCVL